jgi:hypothetical protein
VTSFSTCSSLSGIIVVFGYFRASSFFESFGSCSSLNHSYFLSELSTSNPHFVSPPSYFSVLKRGWIVLTEPNQGSGERSPSRWHFVFRFCLLGPFVNDLSPGLLASSQVGLERHRCQSCIRPARISRLAAHIGWQMYSTHRSCLDPSHGRIGRACQLALSRPALILMSLAG